MIPVRPSALRRTILATAAAASGLLASAVAAADQTVQVGPGTFFSPPAVTVAPGETVTWQFQAFHTSTSDSQTGAEVWDSGFLSSGSFAHTFQTPGTYPRPRSCGDGAGLGVGISMDDFGTGYSSLNYLKRFPIDRVKLDRSFVRDVVKNSEDAAIVRAIIAMAHTLKMRVVAEGVEEEDQLVFLHQHQCDEMQGYLFSRPVAPEEFLKLLLRRQPQSAIA